MPSNIKASSLPFKEQAEFFKRKLLIPTNKWDDIYAAEHDWAFMVAGANRDDILASFKDAVEKIIDGETLEEFRQRFDSIITTTGWSYNGGRNWRTRIIYETNLNSSYMAGRYKQLMEVREYRPYWQYIHNDSVEHPRPHHKAWGDQPVILRWDHPWWKKHFPSNGWGCQCRVHALSQADLDRLGLTVTDMPWEEEPGVPVGIDPGFEYTPGKARLLSAIPPEIPQPPMGGSTGGPGVPNTRPKPNDALPPPRPVDSSELLPDNLSADDYANAFLKEFDATLDTPVVWKDVLGEPLVIGKELFTDATGATKGNKRGRGPYMKLLAKALKSPDEIWVRLEYQFNKKKNTVRRRYIARWQLPGLVAPVLLVFEEGKDGWYGITAFSENNAEKVDEWRVGIRLYKREE